MAELIEKKTDRGLR